MRRLLLSAIMMVATVLCQAQQIRMMLTSDPHVMSTELFDVPYGEAFLDAMHEDLKVIENSQQLFDDFIEKVIREHPDILLIPGDLSREGEKVSHEHVAMKLHEVRQEGIKVYVIPGNHDMENPLGRKYQGKKVQKVPSISEEEFPVIYSEDGYSEAVMADRETNSYMVYPADGMALICVNSIIPNNYKGRYVHGRVSYNLLSWIESAATKARDENRIPVLMIHHELMEHHDEEEHFAATAMLNQEKGLGLPSLEDVRNTLRKAGIQVAITGHYHIQSIKSVQTPYGKLTDITTGALSGFPSPYRYINLDTQKGVMRVTSSNMFGTMTKEWPQTDLAKKEFDRLRYMVQLYVPKVGDKKTDMKVAYEYLAKPFDTALCALAAGDEEYHNPKVVIKDCMEAFDDYVHHTLLYDITESEKLKMDQDGPYAHLYNMLSSIMNNYVGNKKNNTPDNAYIIKLEK